MKWSFSMDKNGSLATCKEVNLTKNQRIKRGRGEEETDGILNNKVVISKEKCRDYDLIKFITNILKVFFS